MSALPAIISDKRPRPPIDLVERVHGMPLFWPAPDLAEWVAATFIQAGGALENQSHAHLQSATIGFLWTGLDNAKKGRAIVGQAELGDKPGGSNKWPAGRARMQLEAWFGEVPDFIITLHAPSADQADAATFCALVEHELSHCAQETDAYGAPKWTSRGPSWCMRGHDVEEFVDVVARYGADAAGVR